MFKWALGHYPDYAERYMVHQQGIQGAIEHYTHPERVAWQSMCATDEGMLKGEQWCKRCIWGNLLPEWKRTFGGVENISSADFVSLWTGRIDHLAERFSLVDSGGAASPLRTHPHRPTKLTYSSLRTSRSRLLRLQASVVSARAARRLPTIATNPFSVHRTVKGRTKPSMG
jgi:hypothetical protein